MFCKADHRREQRRTRSSSITPQLVCHPRHQVTISHRVTGEHARTSPLVRHPKPCAQVPNRLPGLRAATTATRERHPPVCLPRSTFHERASSWPSKLLLLLFPFPSAGHIYLTTYLLPPDRSIPPASCRPAAALLTPAPCHAAALPHPLHPTPPLLTVPHYNEWPHRRRYERATFVEGADA